MTWIAEGLRVVLGIGVLLCAFSGLLWCFARIVEELGAEDQVNLSGLVDRMAPRLRAHVERCLKRLVKQSDTIVASSAV